jgi:valyl-tRNA synthetase
MDKNYDHKIKESQMYKMWEDAKAFSPEGAAKLRPSNGQPYSVLMPPPNANAPLHCGHATYSIQDLMVRFKRMQGFDSLYLPGTDHAGFETQVVYERQLKKEGKSRFDFDRAQFYEDVLNFVKENSNIATDQLKQIGMSADWDRNTFMLDKKVIDIVNDTFLKLVKDGLVYRDGYMVNYSTFHGTTFSDLETEYKDSISPLYYVKYKLTDSDEFLTVATVRPETIYADVAIAVNPKDKKLKKFVGKKVLNPLNNREMIVIEDEYVDMEFGTGALKITPAHDMNDYQIGKKHNLELISLINLDGKMNANAGEVEGMFPKPARTKVAEILKERGAIEKIDENYANRILVDYKDQMPIEPMLLPNWFINIDKLMDPVIESVQNEVVKFNLPEWKRDILHWITSKKPWPISRQTVFGIRIPAWYEVNKETNPDIQVTFLTKNKEYKTGNVYELLDTFSLDEIKAGLQKVIAPANSKFVIQLEAPGENFLQETDTFDTWFSSGQWPMTTLGYPNGEDFKKYYPTNLLDSGYDIMFFWIARMIMFGLYLAKDVPFKEVYFHGMVTDKSGQKMSKSKGNVINPMEFVDKYGADPLRMGIIVGGNTEARFTPLDEDKVRGYRNFANKIWNIARYIEMKGEIKPLDLSHLQPEDKGILEALDKLIPDVTDYLDNLKFKFAGEAVYEFVWDKLANTYLEAIKDRTDDQALAVLNHAFLTSLKLLHPFMPFITETVWQELKPQNESEMIIVSKWPTSI